MIAGYNTVLVAPIRPEFFGGAGVATIPLLKKLL